MTAILGGEDACIIESNGAPACDCRHPRPV